MKRLLFIFGTRPEAIKMIPVIQSFYKHPEHFETRLCITAQHREMLDMVMDFFEMKADYDLNLMKPNQTLNQLTADVITELKDVLQDFKADYVFVHGDTTTSMAASIAAYYSGSRVCHVEAGLRTHNKYSPFPEEMNRQITGRIADIHFAPTMASRQNLLNENIATEKILVTGNTVIDALLYAVDKVNFITDPEIEELKAVVDTSKKIVLVTGHRRENFGDGFINICTALNKIAELAGENVQIVYPVHLNPNVKKPVFDLLGQTKNIHLIAPLGYPAFVWLMKKASLIITDSGGVQEEAPSLGKPVLLMRENTERPEAVAAGAVKIVGTDIDKIVSEALVLLSDPVEYKKMSEVSNPYGDGKASERIVDFIMAQQW